MKKELRIEDLTIEQKIGLVLVGRRLDEHDNYEFACELAKNHALGGVQIDPNVPQQEYMEIKNVADYPILVGADMENGCQFGEYLISGNISLSMANSLEDTYTFAKVTAIQAKKLGYNMIWSPIADVLFAKNPLSVKRSFGPDKDLVSRMCAEYIRAFTDVGIISTTKHYPYMITSLYDGHMKNTANDFSKEEIASHIEYMYKNITKNLGYDLPGIMTGHNPMPSVDPDYPTSVSKKMIDIIKGLGYNGLTITDSFAMMGIVQKFGNDKILGHAINAGNDILLPNYRLPLRESYNYLLQNYKDGMFTEERLNDAVAHVLKAQSFTQKHPENLEITKEDEEAIIRINRNCTTVIKDDPSMPTALDKDKKYLFVVLTENTYNDENGDVLGEVTFVKWWDPKYVGKFLKENFPNATIAYVNEFQNHVQNEYICNLADKKHHDEVVFFTFCTSNSYQGTDDLTERMRMLIDCVSYNVSTIVHFGTPYAMEKVVHIPKIIFGTASKLSVENNLKVVTGEYEANGKLPMKLNLQ